MKDYQHGVHTIEVTTEKQVCYSRLPRDIPIDGEGKNRYRVNITQLSGMEEYNPVTKTEQAIAEICRQMEEAGGRKAWVTRIDYRFDSYGASFEEELPLMRLFVYTFAHKYGLWERIMETSKRAGGVPLSVRAMPDEESRSDMRGIEFYNKPEQKRTRAFGEARLELRRLNMSGERLSHVLSQWRNDLLTITQADYKAMLASHVRDDILRHGDSRRIIAESERFILSPDEIPEICRQTGRREQRRSRFDHLPKWKDLQRRMSEIGDLLTKFE